MVKYTIKGSVSLKGRGDIIKLREHPKALSTKRGSKEARQYHYIDHVARVMTSGTVKTIEMQTMGNPQPSPNFLLIEIWMQFRGHMVMGHSLYTCVESGIRYGPSHLKRCL